MYASVAQMRGMGQHSIDVKECKKDPALNFPNRYGSCSLRLVGQGCVGAALSDGI